MPIASLTTVGKKSLTSVEELFLMHVPVIGPFRQSSIWAQFAPLKEARKSPRMSRTWNVGMRDAHEDAEARSRAEHGDAS